jgi:phosphoribosyl-ATP pyrophosphohydrolase
MNESQIPEGNVFAELMGLIEDRKANMPAGSYSTSLFAGGIDKIGSKIIEEAKELVEAGREAPNTRKQHVVHEAADLVFHMFVLLGHCRVTLAQVEAELQGRFGVSGLDEKASRGQKGERDE